MRVPAVQVKKMYKTRETGCGAYAEPTKPVGAAEQLG